MSAYLVNRARKMKAGGPIEKSILLYLACTTQPAGCFPSRERIAADLEMSVATVKRNLKSLEAIGLIRRRKEFSGDRVMRTLYDVLPDGVREYPSDGVTVNGSDSLMGSESQTDGVRESRAYKEVTEENYIAGKKPPAPITPQKHTRVNPDHRAGMDILVSEVGTLSDPKAQAGALKWMFTQGFTIDQIKRYFVRHRRSFGSDYRCSYLTLKKYIGQWAIDEAKHEPEITSALGVDYAEEAKRDRLAAITRRQGGISVQGVAAS